MNRSHIVIGTTSNAFAFVCFFFLLSSESYICHAHCSHSLSLFVGGSLANIFFGRRRLSIKCSITFLLFTIESAIMWLLIHICFFSSNSHSLIASLIVRALYLFRFANYVRPVFFVLTHCFWNCAPCSLFGDDRGIEQIEFHMSWRKMSEKKKRRVSCKKKKMLWRAASTVVYVAVHATGND